VPAIAVKKSEKNVILGTLLLAAILIAWFVFLVADIKGVFGYPWETAPFFWRVYTIGEATLLLLSGILLPLKRRTGRWFALPALAAALVVHGYAIMVSPSAPSAGGRELGLVGSLFAVVVAVFGLVFLFLIAPRYERRRFDSFYDGTFGERS
jgi:hypothetical protein